MSNIYIQEPPTSGKVLLVTSAGDIEIELWTRETPKACRNFIQLCMEGYFNGTIFHRVVHNFIVQGGDPTGTGEGGKSIYGSPFKDEIHSRLRFTRRGLVAMANSGKDDNGSQFFFTLDATPELQGKHTIFGKVVGDTIFNMLKLDSETDENEKPLFCHKILKCEVLINPFPDIVPRELPKKKEKERKKKEKNKGVKNFKLLSFGEEAEEDEEETAEISKKSKIKSSHDILNDPKLSSEPALDVDDVAACSSQPSDLSDNPEKDEEPIKEEVEEEYYLGKSREEELLRRKAEIQRQIDDLKKDYRNNKKGTDAKEQSNDKKDEKDVSNEPKDNEFIEEYKTNLTKYGKMKTQLPLKGSDRESFTLQMLSKFKTKLKEVKETATDDDNPDFDAADTEKWMAHTLKFDELPVLARDANTKDDTWYDITDPRNPINKRRRETSEKSLNQKPKRMRE